MNDSNQIRDAFAHYRYRRASQLLEGDSDAHWVIAYQHADELIDFDSFEAAWVLQESAITAQRQELARVEAERDAMEAMVSMLEEKEWAEHASNGPVSSRLETCITTLMNELSEANERADEATVSGMAYAEQRDTAQAQLSEVLSLYQQIRHVVVDNANCDQSGKYHSIDDAFMAIAQAEQQEAPGREVTFRDLLNIPTSQLPREEEAQGAQAWDEQRECCNEECGWKGSTDRVLSGHGKVPDVGPLCPECGETTERAALATQPAEQADDELSARPAEGEWIEWGGNGTHAPFDEMLGADIRFRDGVEFSPPAVIGLRWNHAGNDKDIIAYRLHKPAVRGAEHE